MKIVLDTNVILISLPKVSPYRPILDGLLSGQYTLILNNEILSEYIEILERYTSPQIANNFARLLLNLKNVEIQEVYYHWRLFETDPDDNKFVDCAIAGNARYIVSEDRHFNILSTIEFPTIEVITADLFKEILERQ